MRSCSEMQSVSEHRHSGCHTKKACGEEYATQVAVCQHLKSWHQLVMEKPGISPLPEKSALYFPAGIGEGSVQKGYREAERKPLQVTE